MILDLTDFVTQLTGEKWVAKNTGGRRRPTRDDVSRLAYHFYEAQGRQDGHDVDDWVRAEQHLTRRGA